MQNYVVPENVAQAIMNYLVQQPYKDVFQLVDALRAVKTMEQHAASAAPVPDAGE